MSRERSSKADNVEDPVWRHYFARESAAQNDPVQQSSSSQPRRTPRKRQTSRSSGDDVEKEALKPEPIRPHSPGLFSPEDTPNNAHDSDNPEANIPENDKPSPSRRFRQQSYDRSNSYPLPGRQDPPLEFILPMPPPAPGPQMAPQNYYDYASRPEQAPYMSYAYEPGIRSVPQPSRQMPYTTYDSGIRSVPQPSRQRPDSMYDPTPRSVPLPPRQRPYDVYDSAPQSVPLSWPQQTPYSLNPYPGQQSGQRYARARRGDAFVANDPFNPSKAKKGSDIPYDSFDNMPTDMDPPSVPYVIPSQQQPIILPQPHVIPSQPPFVPSQPPIIPAQPSVIHPSDPYPSQPPIVPPPPQSMPMIPPQPTIIYPSDPYPSQRPYPDWAQPGSTSAPPMRPAPPPGAPVIPYPAETIPSQPSTRSSTPSPLHPPVIRIPSPDSMPSIPPRSESVSPPPRPPAAPYPAAHYPPEYPPLVPPTGIRPPLRASGPGPSTASPPTIPDEETPIRPTAPRPTPERIDTSKPVHVGIPAQPVFSMPAPQGSPTSSPISPVFIPPSMPMRIPTTSTDSTEDKMTPTSPLPPRLPRPRPPLTAHSPTLTLDEPSGDPSVPLPSEYPYGYGPYLEQHGIRIDNEKFSFRSTFRKLLTWPFTRPKLKPSPNAYLRPPYGYQPYPQAYPPYYTPSQIETETPSLTQVVTVFVTRTLPTQIYLHFLLRLPSLYFSRVARIFEEADLTLPQIKKMALETASKDMMSDDFYIFETENVPPQYTRLKTTWEGFIDSVMREWKTFNIISVLLLSAILTILQIQSAEQDPIIRYTALASLICALISLLFGCMYIIRFGSMRKTYKAAEWALEAKRTRTTVWWNVWVLLAMPVIWLAWSILLYIACIMTFIWRTTSQDVSPPLIMSNTTILGIRVALSAVLGLGMVYATLIMSTFSRYGETMDKAWRRRISGWIEQKSGVYGPGQGPDPYIYLPPSMQPYPPAYPNPIFQPGAGPAYSFAPSFVPPSRPSSPPSPELAPDGTRFGHPYDRKRSYPYSDYEAPYADPGPSVREESRRPSRRESENRSTSTSAYRPFFSSQEPFTTLRSPVRDDTGPQSSNKEQDDATSSAAPHVPMKIYLPPPDQPRGARGKRVSVPPPTTLPPIPGTPGSAALSYLTTPILTNSPPSMRNVSLRPDDQNSGNADPERLETDRQPRRDSHVQFRSPLVSAQSSQDRSRTGSEREAVESAKSSISGVTDVSTNVPWTPFPSPISRDP